MGSGDHTDDDEAGRDQQARLGTRVHTHEPEAVATVASAEEHAPVPEDQGGRRTIAFWLSLPLISLLLVTSVQMLLYTPYRIPSESMLPTLEIGDRVIVNRQSYSLGDIERGQVIVFEAPPELESRNDVIKRVVALPGETIRFIDGQVYIDNQRMLEPYVVAGSTTRSSRLLPGCDVAAGSASIGCLVPEGHVFVLGDNREDSIDSRQYGPVPIDTIVGRAFVRVWPLTNLNLI